MPATYIAAVLHTNGYPAMLYGPFDTEEAADAFIARNDEFLGDLENDIATEENLKDSSLVTEVDTVVMIVNDPAEVFTGE